MNENFKKDLSFCVLLDIYGGMLTDNQRDITELYYNEDLSLAEIAEHKLITKQGVRDIIKRSEKVLLKLEEKLKFKEIYLNSEFRIQNSELR